MKWTRCFIATIVLLALLLYLQNISAFAQEIVDVGQFPEGIIEVPQGTKIDIDDYTDTVTITNSPVKISEGDTFVVYLQDLPIGFIADSVVIQENKTIIASQKANKSIYAFLEEEGIIELTPDMYEFIPAENVVYSKSVMTSDVSIGGGDGLSYKDGKLTLAKSFGGNTAQIALSNLCLRHTASNGDMTLSLQGNWSISTPALSTSEDILDDVPLGVIHIAGIGKITIKMSMTIGLSMTCDFSGSFSVGFSTSGEEAGGVTSTFKCNEKTVSGKGKISASLKITAGVDILIAAADLYGEVGVTTELDTKSTTNQSTKETTFCSNYRIYVFLKSGVEAKFHSPVSGKMKPLVDKSFNLPDEIATPFSVDIHFENGKLVSNCTQGMNIPNRQFGGYTTSFGSTVLTDARERVLETDISLPWDVVVDQDFFIANGNLNLNGYTLIIEGDLIQTGGTLTVGSGTLIVHGNYRIQSYDDKIEDYGNSSGNIVMNNSEGQVIVSGDFIIQTESENNNLTSGSLNIGGDLIQRNANDYSPNFNVSTGCNVTMSAGNTHSILLENPNDNSLGTLVILGDTIIPYSIHLEGMDIVESKLTIQGDLIQNSGTLCVHNGQLEVFGNVRQSGGTFDMGEGNCLIDGSMYHHDGTLNVNNGTMRINGNYLNIGETSSIDDDYQGITSSRGILKMMDDGGIMSVGDSFITYSNYNHGGSLTSGTLFVAGNFIQIGTGTSNYAYNCPGKNFRTQPEHKTVLNGTEKQLVKFDSPDSYFGTFEATNTNIVFEGAFRWLVLGGDVEAETMGAWPYYSEVNHAPIPLNGHKLTIRGNLLHSLGTISIDGGELHVTGDYYIAGPGSTFDTGEDGLETCQGVLSMTNAEDIVRVDGKFLTKSTVDHKDYLKAGTMYVSGDFRQIGTGIGSNSYSASWGANFRAQPEHKTVLNGTEKQLVRFDSSDSYFGTFEATNTNIVFKGAFRWLVLGSDVEAETMGAWPYYSEVNHAPIPLNGHKLTIRGNLLHSLGTISIDGGELHVTGDYYIAGPGSTFDTGEDGLETCQGVLSMTNAEDIVRVDGKFLTKSTVDHKDYLKAGTMYVSGDFRQIGTGIGSNSYSASWGANFRAQPEHKTVLNGTKKQTVRFDSSYSYFGILEIIRPLNEYDFDPNPCWTSLIQPETPIFGEPEFILPTAITVIDEASFEGIAARIVYIPDTCTIIGANAFRDSAVTQIRIPGNCTLGEDVFAECDKVFIFGTIGSDAEDYCNSHTNCMFVEE